MTNFYPHYSTKSQFFFAPGVAASCMPQRRYVALSNMLRT